MRILLIGEYSNVHWTLACGLRQLGHQVTVLSNGDFWKDYPRDLSLVRRPGWWGGLCYLMRLCTLLPRLRGYDVVQFINPMFLELKAERILPVYRYLCRHNRRVVLGAFGMDYYWVHECVTRKPLRYSDFNFGDQVRTDPEAQVHIDDWIDTAKGRLNQMIAADCDGIVAGLYEDWVCYHPHFPHKLSFIPYPIRCDAQPALHPHDRLKVFIGINRSRSVYKGTDIMLRAAQDVAARHPEEMTLTVAESLPFDEYVRLLHDQDVLLDQLYSYTPSMNPLEAMAHGVVCVGGGEPEHYEMLGETQLRPIVNVQPTYESVVEQLEHLVTHPHETARLRQQSVDYIHRHHDYIKVARQYEDFYQSLL